jgi:hypothetical protein
MLRMQVRPAQIADADRAIGVIRRSIQELCEFDHDNEPATLSMWLSPLGGQRHSCAASTIFSIGLFTLIWRARRRTRSRPAALPPYGCSRVGILLTSTSRSACQAGTCFENASR